MRKWVFAVFWLAIALLLAYFLWKGQQAANRLTAQGKEAHDALCANVTNVRSQYDSGLQYLADIRHGLREPIPGITKVDIQQGLDREQAYLKAMSVLKCK